VAFLVGLNLVIIKLVNAIDYKDGRNSGVFGVYVLGVAVGLGVLLLSTIIYWLVRRSAAG
jgi:hypothetical protein